MIRAVLRLWTALRALYAGSWNRYLGRLNQEACNWILPSKAWVSSDVLLVSGEKINVGAILCVRLCPCQIVQAWIRP